MHSPRYACAIHKPAYLLHFTDFARYPPQRGFAKIKGMNSSSKLRNPSDASSSNARLDRGDSSMRRYTAAAEVFRNSAAELIQNLQYLVQAREAYEQSMTASAELRTALDAGDEEIRTLMRQIDQALDISIGKGESETVNLKESKSNCEDRSAKARFL
jgi:hypothetical protein